MTQGAWEYRFKCAMKRLSNKGFNRMRRRHAIWAMYDVIEDAKGFGHRWVAKHVHDNIDKWLNEFNKKETLQWLRR